VPQKQQQQKNPKKHNIINKKRLEGMTQMVEHLPS
jgi:hypothetical protein